MTLKGASVEEMETSVTKEVEEVVNTISGIDSNGVRALFTGGCVEWAASSSFGPSVDFALPAAGRAALYVAHRCLLTVVLAPILHGRCVGCAAVFPHPGVHRCPPLVHDPGLPLA